MGLNCQGCRILVGKDASDNQQLLPSPPLNHSPKCHICVSFKSLQGWGLSHFPGQPVKTFPQISNPNLLLTDVPPFCPLQSYFPLFLSAQENDLSLGSHHGVHGCFQIWQSHRAHVGGKCSDHCDTFAGMELAEVLFSGQNSLKNSGTNSPMVWPPWGLTAALGLVSNLEGRSLLRLIITEQVLHPQHCSGFALAS